MFVVSTVWADISDQEFTIITGSDVKEPFCIALNNTVNHTWIDQVANIQLRLNVEKYWSDVISKVKTSRGVSSNKNKYRKIKIKLQGTDCWMSGKYRLTGDLEDHVGSSNEITHSIKVEITDGRIDNILKFTREIK